MNTLTSNGNNDPLLIKALQELLDHYVELVSSGDAGNWDPEKEGKVAQARAALRLAGSASKKSPVAPPSDAHCKKCGCRHCQCKHEAVAPETGGQLPASDRNTILDAMHYPREYLARWKGKGDSANSQDTLNRLQNMLERTQTHELKAGAQPLTEAEAVDLRNKITKALE